MLFFLLFLLYMDCFAFVSLVNYCKVLIFEVGVFYLWAELIGSLIGVMSL